MYSSIQTISPSSGAKVLDVPAHVTIRVWIGDDRDGVHHARELIMSQGFAPPQTTWPLRPKVISAAVLSQKLQSCFSGIDCI